MRCTRIEFKGFRRLADTSTNIHGRLTAVVGLNESGKSSMLDALRWLTYGEALPVNRRNRSRPPKSDKTHVVRVHYALSEADLELIEDIPTEVKPTSLVKWRNRDGSWGFELRPAPKRVAKPFTNAATQLATTRARLSAQFQNHDVGDDEEGPADWAVKVFRILGQPDATWEKEERVPLARLAAWLDEVPSARATRPRNGRLAALLRAVEDSLATQHPHQRAGVVLRARIPAFVLFQEENRVLDSSHELSDEDLRETPPFALRDLLLIADADLNDLWTHMQASDTTGRATWLERANDRLLAFFSENWNQSNIAVRLNVTGTRLELLVKELRDSGAVTDIAERSDGLRTFVALSAFVAAGGYAVPPILLIDEAETHLHLNAQADMVSVLLKSLDATQVIYTTHSPGCLPSDLGTSIRLMSRDPEHGDASLIRHDFWSSQEPGFGSLLFGMGADAAAFSVCRQAVLGEGPTDMILLPTLIRIATGLDDLAYQIAPGLATVSAAALPVKDVAANVLYLADGDEKGASYVQTLKGRGIPRGRIFALPKGMAVEDLILRSEYLAAVNGLLEAMGRSKRVTAVDLAGDLTVAKALEDWGRAQRVGLPSKVDIAYALLDRESLALTRTASRALVKLHAKFEQAFENVHTTIDP